jgi:hypothetical protein
VAGLEVYTCACGWRDLFVNYGQHLADITRNPV